MRNHEDVDCEIAQEALSARLDGEDEGLAPAATDAHLAECADCRAWFDDVSRADDVLYAGPPAVPVAHTIEAAPNSAIPTGTPLDRRRHGDRPGTDALTVPDGAARGRHRGHLRPLDGPAA